MIALIQKEIVKILSKEENNLSITFVGSSNHKNIEKISDIDIIIICKKLTKKYYEKQINKLKNLDEKFYIEKFENLYINDSFGPLKFNKNRNLVLHVMIYDMDSHKKHVIESPFTCLDWSLYESSYGPNLKDLFPIFNLQIDDFKNSRRSFNDYKFEFKNRKLSYRKYHFISEDKYKEIKKYKSINNIEFIEFMNHIIKFSIINLCKLLSNENKFFSNSEIYTFLPEFKKFETLTKKLDRSVNNLEKLNLKEVEKEFKNFLNFYNNYFNVLEKKYKLNHFYLVRHSKTKLNDGTFLGRRNPDINRKLSSKQISNLSNIKVKKYFTSTSKRAENTIKQITNTYEKNSNLQEIDYGEAEGLNLNELKSKYPYIVKGWKEGKDIRFPKGENTADVEKRFSTFLFENKNSIPFMAFTHQVVIRVALCNSINFDIANSFKFSVPYLKPIKFYIFNENLKLDIPRKELYRMLENE